MRQNLSNRPLPFTPSHSHVLPHQLTLSLIMSRHVVTDTIAAWFRISSLRLEPKTENGQIKDWIAQGQVTESKWIANGQIKDRYLSFIYPLSILYLSVCYPLPILSAQIYQQQLHQFSFYLCQPSTVAAGAAGAAACSSWLIRILCGELFTQSPGA